MPEFELVFDKAYKWVASSIAEKNAFILSLWKVCLPAELLMYSRTHIIYSVTTVWQQVLK